MASIMVMIGRGQVSILFNIYKQSVTVTNIVETNFEVHNQFNSTFNTQTLGKQNPDSSARRKTKKVKLSDSDEDLDDNKDSSESQSTDENPTGRSETPPPRSTGWIFIG